LKQTGEFLSLEICFQEIDTGFAGFFENSAQAVLQRSTSDYMMLQCTNIPGSAARFAPSSHPS
jgi:hypothetical protein